LWHELQELGVEESARLMDSKTHAGNHLTKAQFKELMRLFNVYRRERAPLVGPAKKATMLPVRIAATLAMTRGHKELLITLGQPVPEQWKRLEEQAANAEEGCVDLALQEVIEEDADLIEAHHVAIQSELVEFEELRESAADEAKFEGRSYALREQSKELQSQLAAFRSYRTDILNSARPGTRVMPVTVEGNVGSLLRFLGWASRHYAVSGSPDMRIFKIQGCRDLLDEYVTWLVRDRQISYGSVANYINSLMSAMTFVADQLMHGEEVPPHMEELFSAAFNLRSQSEAQAREDRMYKPRSEQYMTWAECQQVVGPQNRSSHNVTLCLPSDTGFVPCRI